MLPESGRSSATMRRPSVVLPQPDSPTSAKVSPLPISKLTSETACTEPTRRWSTPFRIGNSFTTCSSTRTGAPAGGGPARAPRRPRPAHGRRTPALARLRFRLILGGCLAGPAQTRRVDRAPGRTRVRRSGPPGQRRVPRRAHLSLREPATGSEAAARRRRDQARAACRECCTAPWPGPVDQRGHRLEQRLRVRVPHAREQRAGGRWTPRSGRRTSPSPGRPGRR